jgi:hypothetical protein
MTLTDFLEARYAEREAAAGEPRTWTVGHHVCTDVMGECDEPCEYLAECRDGKCDHCRIEGSDGMVIYDEGGHDAADAAHIALNDPASVLADIAAKRQILAWWEQQTAGLRSERNKAAAIRALPGGQVLCHLAEPFTEHPDYDPSWRLEP